MSYARMLRIKPLKTCEQTVFYPFLLCVSTLWAFIFPTRREGGRGASGSGSRFDTAAVSPVLHNAEHHKQNDKELRDTHA